MLKITKDNRPRLIFDHEYEYESSILKLEGYKSEVTIYFDAFDAVKFIMLNDDEFEPLDDDLHGLFILAGNHFYSVFDVVSQAEAIITTLNEEALREENAERRHINFYSNPNNR